MSASTEHIDAAPSAFEPEIVATTDIEFSPTLSEIAKALIRAQSSMDEIFKDSTNPHFRSKYAGLPACLNATRPALLANGIALLQPATSSPDASVVYVTTMFLHESGEWMRGKLGLQPAKEDPQGAGSAITYGRRYTLLGMCGIAPEDDDDGNAASRASRAPRTQPRSNPAPAPANAPQVKEQPVDGKPEQRDANTPGAASEESLGKLRHALAVLGGNPAFTITKESALFKEATNGRTDEPDLSLLSENEARRLGKILKPLYDAEQLRIAALDSERAHEQDRVDAVEMEIPF